MSDSHPPFRADAVGSLLRSAPLKEARAKRAQDAICDDQLKAIEDEEIKAIIRKQEDVGLELATDGEFRRSWWHFDFLLEARRLRTRHARSWHPISRHPDQAGKHPRHGQDRFSAATIRCSRISSFSRPTPK